MMNFAKKAWLKIKGNPDVVFYIFMGLYFALMLVLAYFRDMVNDEALYYRETWLMSEVLKNGEWIGNYGVGLHGFLFKLPPALLFLITGPSIDIVTIYNILIGMLTGFLFFKLLKSTLKNSWFAVFATVFMMTSFHFVLSMPTYLRDIPSLSMIVVFLYGVVRKWNKGWMSLVFLLLLDSKEYVFLIFAVFYVLWLLISSKETRFFAKIWDVFKTSVIVFLPSLLWVVLMFTTGLIPVNMYLSSTLGLVKGDFTYSLTHFGPEFAGQNSVEGGRKIAFLSTENISVPFLRVLVDSCNFVSAYVGKIFYPRSFSFISVPKVVIFPIIYSSILLVWKYIKSKKKGFDIFVFSSLLTLIWLFIYIIRTSHGRYLLPILPFIGILLVYIFFFNAFTKKQKMGLIIGTGIFVLLGFVFEVSYIIPKILIETFLFVLLFISLLKPKFKLCKGIFISLLSVFSLGIALLFSYTQGQINGYINWGRNNESDKVAEILPKDKTLWISDNGSQDLVAVFRGETYSPVEWHWTLKEILPKKALLKTMGPQYNYAFLITSDYTTYLLDLETFKKNISYFKVEKVITVYSTLAGESFDGQIYYSEFIKLDWLDLEKEVQLKNKIVYIFDVKD